MLASIRTATWPETGSGVANVQTPAPNWRLTGGDWSSAGAGPPSFDRLPGASGGPFLSRDKQALSRVRSVSSASPVVSNSSSFMAWSLCRAMIFVSALPVLADAGGGRIDALRDQGPDLPVVHSTADPNRAAMAR